MAKPVYVDGELWAYVPDEATDEDIKQILQEQYRGPAFKDPEKKDLATQIGEKASAFSVGLNDWLYGGWSDEIGAALETGKRLASGEIKIDQADEVFHERAQLLRGDIQRKAAEHPVSTAAGRTVGGAVPILATAGAGAVTQTAAKAAPLIETVGKAAAGGALAGAGSAERSEDRLSGAIVGGSIGAGLSVAPAIVKSVGNAAAQSKPGKWAMSLIPGRTPPQKRAAKLIMKAMLEDRNKAIQGAEKRLVDKGGNPFTEAELAGLSPEDKARVLNSQAARYGDMEETVAEMFDPNVQGLARATATVPGPTRVKAEKLLTDRHKGIGDRLMQAVTSNTGKKRGDVVEMVKEMQAARREQAKVNYQRAHNSPPPDNAEFLVDQITEADIGRAGAREGASLLDTELARTSDPARRAVIKQDKAYLQAISKPAAQRSDADVAAVARGPSMRSLDYLQRGMGTVAESEYRSSPSKGSAIEGAQRSLINELKKASPEFELAHNTYREGSRPIDYAELGRKSLKMSDLELTEQLGDMSAADEDAFAAGVAQAFAEALDKGEKALIKKFNDQPGFRRILQSSFSPEAFNALSSRIERETDMLGTYSSIKQKSAALQAGEDIRSATDDGPADKFVTEVLSSGSLKGPVMRRVGEAWKMARKPGIYNPKVNQELGDLLYSKATPENLKKLDNFLIENTDAPQVQTPARGGDWRVTTPLVQSMDPNERRKDVEAGRDSIAADADIEFDPADGPVPEFSPDFPKGPNRRGAGGPDAMGQGQGMGINYNAQPGAGLLEESDDKQWVNDPVTGAWRLRRPNDRTRPNQTLNVDITRGYGT